MTSYMMAQLRGQIYEYGNQVLECLERAKRDTNADLEKEVVQNIDLGGIRRSVYEIFAKAEAFEEEHKKLSKQFKKYYRGLLSEDHEPLGVRGR